MSAHRQAFPRAGYDGPAHNEYAEIGMTIREYFMGQVAANLNVTLDATDEDIERTAKLVRRIADALVEASE